MTFKISNLPDLNQLLSSRAQAYPLRVNGGVTSMQLQRLPAKSGQKLSPANSDTPKQKETDNHSNRAEPKEASTSEHKNSG